MQEDKKEDFNLSEGAIQFLETHKANSRKNILFDTDYTFQIEKSSKNKSELYNRGKLIIFFWNCTLIDKESKYGGFFVKYNQ